MKVLLDENLPHDLLRPLSHHEVKTVDDMGWKGIKNGELVKLIEAEKFDVFLTGDKNLSKQTNMADRHVALVVMSAVNWPIIRNYVPLIVRARRFRSFRHSQRCSLRAVPAWQLKRNRRALVLIEVLLHGTVASVGPARIPVKGTRKHPFSWQNAVQHPPIMPSPVQAPTGNSIGNRNGESI